MTLGRRSTCLTVTDGWSSAGPARGATTRSSLRSDGSSSPPTPTFSCPPSVTRRRCSPGPARLLTRGSRMRRMSELTDASPVYHARGRLANRTSVHRAPEGHRQDSAPVHCRGSEPGHATGTLGQRRGDRAAGRQARRRRPRRRRRRGWSGTLRSVGHDSLGRGCAATTPRADAGDERPWRAGVFLHVWSVAVRRSGRNRQRGH